MFKDILGYSLNYPAFIDAIELFSLPKLILFTRHFLLYLHIEVENVEISKAK